MIAKLSLAAAALALTAGTALAGGDCSYKMRMASTPPAAQATPVDVAILVPPTATSAETADVTVLPLVETPVSQPVQQ
jgi:hypothetical protein